LTVHGLPSAPTELPTLFDFDMGEWKAALQAHGEPAYRATQIWKSIYKNFCVSPQEMTDLPKNLREWLQLSFRPTPLTYLQRLTSADGTTWKYLYQLPDGALLETVRMAYAERETACLSTQSGCGMGCVFCATGKLGLLRSLSAGEIIAQGMEMARMLMQEGNALTNIVMMGMGEPFVNYDATWKAIQRWIDPTGFNFGARRITISTVGIVPGILQFASEHSQVNLAVSLHAANDALRDQLLPINRKYPLRELMSAIGEYMATTRRRVSLEWAFIDGVNDTDKDAEELAALCHSIPNPLFHVNLILLNPIDGFSGKPSRTARQQAFQQILEKRHIACTIRLRRGLDIMAGCGQLAAHASGNS
jgi:23S rRNA (adenine2503-C2)-methyltransferase